MSNYIPTIGLEIHAELKTKTKMFCDCRNDPEEKRPNANICPICLAHPGTLPVINQEAVRQVLRVGTAISGKIGRYSEFDRKNYFYPDIPKGYQISQYKYPLVSGGSLLGVSITRVHLEEDTARSIHDREDFTLLDFNRAGIPLMELVTEPAITDVKMAVAFAKELQLILRYLGAGFANLEKGEMRLEANVSVRPEGEEKLGTKVEVKNLNSFKALERAILFEIARQGKLLEGGGAVTQETRGWDDAKGATFSQRLKEESNDYRYFPDPDLPKLYISEIPEFSSKALKESLPELPTKRRERLQAKAGLSEEYAQTLTFNEFLSSVFDILDQKFEEKTSKQLAANYLLTDVQGLLLANPSVSPTPGELAELLYDVVSMIRRGELSSRGAKDSISAALLEGGSAEEVARRKGLIQEKNPEIMRQIVREVILQNPKVVLDFKAGKTNSIKFLVGMSMKASRGSGNPSVIQGLLEEELSSTAPKSV